MEIKNVASLTLLLSSVMLGVIGKNQPCLPSNPAKCGGRNLTDENITAAENDEYGPNVCKYNRSYSTHVYEYHLAQYCSYTVFGPNCVTICSNSGMCDKQSTVIVHKVQYDCCAGFTVLTDDDNDQEKDTSHTTSVSQSDTSKSESRDSLNTREKKEHESSSHSNISPRTKTTRTNTKSTTNLDEGCPTVLAEDLMSCFTELELQQLAGLFKIFVDVDTSSTQLTAFVPTDEAVQARLLLLNGNIIDQAVNSLFVGSFQPSSSLTNGDILPSLAGFSLHISKLKPPFSEETRYYVNGAEITRRDACKVPGAIVHVVDQFFPASSKPVIDVVSSSLNLTTMAMLLEASGMAKQLLSSCPKVTLFAPIDQSLEDLNNQTILDCLKEEQNQESLAAFLLQHMVPSVEYNSTLFLRSSLVSKNCYSLSHQKKCTTINVSVHDNVIILGKASEVIEHDIPTASGVVHLISKPLMGVANLTNICYPLPSTTNTAEITPAISITSIGIITVTKTITSTVIVTPSACPI